jgi:riboflavin kinase / FMN adenylyltransferase
MSKLVGTVVSGKGEGRKIGYPTANLKVTDGSRPPVGVYACWVQLENNKKVPGILISGVFLESTGDLGEEVYLLDFSDDLYDQKLSLEIVGKIREVVKVFNTTDLVKLIEHDIELTRRILKL